MPEILFPPVTKLYPFYGPGQWGVQGADRPLGLRLDSRSNIFYVDSGHPLTSDNNDGTDPDNPLQTVTHALVHATTNANDFIVVRQMTNALETWPIAITKNRVHLISTFYDSGKGPEIRPTGATAGISIAADHVEIAGFEIGGSANLSAIDFNNAASRWGADIHHNRFCFQWVARDGIETSGVVDNPHLLIHENWFGAGINRDGIRFGFQSTRTEVWGNEFWMDNAAGIGIHLMANSTAMRSIHDNCFKINGAVSGDAITCDAGSAGCYIYNNQATELAAAGAQNPYLENGLNHWGLNYRDITATLPA